MPALDMERIVLHCLRCHHSWTPMSMARPVQCPRCKSTAWDKRYKHVHSQRTLDAALACETCRSAQGLSVDLRGASQAIAPARTTTVEPIRQPREPYHRRTKVLPGYERQPSTSEPHP